MRLGLRKVYWGVTESQHLVDVINQTEGVENLDGEDKLGQPMLNLALIVFFAPLLMAIAAAVKWDTSGPVFFRQRRNGYQGRAFRIMKFRTMTVMEDGEAPNQVSKVDDRVTRVGRILRKYRLD